MTQRARKRGGASGGAAFSRATKLASPCKKARPLNESNQSGSSARSAADTAQSRRTARLRDEECAGSRVPRRQAELEEAVEDAGCDVGEVQRGATGAADRTRFHEERPEDREIPIDQVLLAERKARRESRALEVLARR